jgi:hypothetical protein
MRMRIDIQKLDERIKKLQEVRRIAADPELATILVEFMSAEDVLAAPVSMPKPDDLSTPRVDNTHDFVKDVVSEARDGLWSRKR